MTMKTSFLNIFSYFTGKLLNYWKGSIHNYSWIYKKHILKKPTLSEVQFKACMQSRKDLYFITLKGVGRGKLQGDFRGISRKRSSRWDPSTKKVSYYSENNTSNFIVLRLVVKKIFKEFDKFRWVVKFCFPIQGFRLRIDYYLTNIR